MSYCDIKGIEGKKKSISHFIRISYFAALVFRIGISKMALIQSIECLVPATEKVTSNTELVITVQNRDYSVTTYTDKEFVRHFDYRYEIVLRSAFRLYSYNEFVMRLDRLYLEYKNTRHDF